ncbi:hypothetical protein LNQ52_12540 [Klebsiella pneumoniae subsp. pneumoniae]|nr:hypothetical protein [Klebsiella pneumoniae subsp. pneumoniae]
MKRKLFSTRKLPIILIPSVSARWPFPPSALCWAAGLSGFISKGRYNPAIGIAGVSCLPTTAKISARRVNQARTPTPSSCR